MRSFFPKPGVAFQSPDYRKSTVASSLKRTRSEQMDESKSGRCARLVWNLFKPDDLTLIILKGHLAAEEQLTKIVCKGVAFPSAIKQGRLRYHQLCSISKAMYYTRDNQWVWPAVEKLNTLRNELAHHLESTKLESMINEFLYPLERRYIMLDAGYVATDIPARLRSMLSFLIGILEAY